MDQDASRKYAPSVPWTSLFVGLMAYIFVILRKLSAYEHYVSYNQAKLVLGASFLLFLAGIIFWKSSRRWLPVFFVLQVILIQWLALMKPVEDTWGVLYMFLVFLALEWLSFRTFAILGIVFSASIVGTMMVTFGPLDGLGRGVFFVASGAVVIVYYFQYRQAEAARRESNELLANLKLANQKLTEYAAQVEVLSSEQERNRLARELHDSVGQMIFSISLNTQAARMLLQKDPARLPGQLEQLQELTASALSQMRALINEWKG